MQEAQLGQGQQLAFGDSVEGLVRNTIQKAKIDMANEVIDAGRFDMQTTMEERKITLESLLQVLAQALHTFQRTLAAWEAHADAQPAPLLACYVLAGHLLATHAVKSDRPSDCKVTLRLLRRGLAKLCLEYSSAS